ncbi:MAG: hypothetical protein IM550_06515 [Microcystis sp. M54BS1]|uniref:hypothetical protein n=1 Tax=unclassified Microcystis TaxID=2643300 RepID=UPI00257DEE55|nr:MULTISPECIES: hypothetical protein [unclassified Microcystis]MCA2538893.1 hypothetical protein [Microcystis sp. M54BS1]MCA2596537.1 hypothetical protein [Microcystis sp. M38BS1]MCA2611986.1 hypothetical protein [Microcystis sp. M27BS1]MCA2504768.1 hypothetical protein [Microcystis sp. M62BS1]MCA2511019.1 hypothetical protein [Microcystis sp. M60BS1]
MDYQHLEKEFDLILEKPLWMRPIMLSELAKKNKISITSLKASFDSFWNQRIRENQLNKG